MANLKVETKIDLYRFETVFYLQENSFWQVKTNVFGSKGLVEEVKHSICSPIPQRKIMLERHFEVVGKFFN